MDKNKFIKLLPLFILLLMVSTLLISFFSGVVLLMKPHKIGLVLLTIAIAAQIFNERIGYQLTGVILLLGVFTIAAFTPAIYTFYFRAGMLKISFDYLCLPTLFIYIFIHRNEIPKWFATIFS